MLFSAERKSEVQLVVRDMKKETVWEVTATLIWDPLLTQIMKIHMLKDMQITVKMYLVSSKYISFIAYDLFYYLFLLYNEHRMEKKSATQKNGIVVK